MNYTDLATTVTQQLVAQIETGPGTWRMPWHTVPGLFDVRNASTGDRYRGANTVSLALQAIEAEHPTGWWSTYRQWSDLCAQVRKGKRSTRIVKWVPAKRKDTEPAPASASTDEDQRTLVPRVYSVFNAAQVDGWTPQWRSGGRGCPGSHSGRHEVSSRGGETSDYQDGPTTSVRAGARESGAPPDAYRDLHAGAHNPPGQRRGVEPSGGGSH